MAHSLLSSLSRSLAVGALVVLALTPEAVAQPGKGGMNWVPGVLVMRARGPEFVEAMRRELREMGLPTLFETTSGTLCAVRVPVGFEVEVRDHLKRSEWAAWVCQDFASEGGMVFDPPPSEMPQPGSGSPPWDLHSLWFLQNTGQEIADYQSVTLEGVPGADVDILRAWEICQGDPSILVAVLDTGIDSSLPEFAGRIYEHELVFVCPAPLPVCAGVNPNMHWCYPTYGSASDNHGHGTAVASVVGANADNGTPSSTDGTQFAGVDPSCTLVIARVAYDNNFPMSAAAAALDEIATNEDYAGVRVINMSMAGWHVPPQEEEAATDAMVDMYATIDVLHQAGVTFVTISGNGALNDFNANFPNAWEPVVMVGATNNQDERWTSASFNSRPSNYLDFMAPGWGMYTARWGDACNLIPQFGNGTSAAAPVVAGIASLLYARANKLGIAITPAIVYECLQASASDLGMSVPNSSIGWGRVNAYLALVHLEETYYHCAADLTHGSTPGVWGYGVANGVVDADDLAFFTAAWYANDLAIADIASMCIDCEHAGCLLPNGVVNASDFFAYLCLYNAGCP